MRGICLPCQSRGGAFVNFALPVGRAFANPGATPSFRHARGFLSKYNYTEDFTGKTSRLGHFSRTGKKMKRFVKACSRFYACISSLLIKPELHSEIGSYQRETTFLFWLLNQTSVNIILTTSFRIYKTTHNR